MIEGVIVTPLQQVSDERGRVMHMLREDSPLFQRFGEIKFVLYDDRAASPTRGEVQEIFLSPHNYCLVTVPPLIWNGFKGIGAQSSIVANCATLPHDPAEIERKSPFDPCVPYDWQIQHR